MCIYSIREGDKFLSCGHDKTIRVYHTKAARPLGVCTGHESIVYCAEFTPERNGRRIISCGHDAQMIIWDTETCTVLWRRVLAHRTWVLSITIAIDGKCIITSSGDHTAKIWWPVPLTTGWMRYFEPSPEIEERYYQLTTRQSVCSIM